MSEQHNLLLITVDAWRPDFTDAHEGVPLLPALDTVSGKTVRFERAYANGPWTTPPLVSLFTGERPSVHGVHFRWSSPRTDTPSVCKTLAAAGWNTPNICYLNRIGNYTNLGYIAAESPPKGASAPHLVDALAKTPEPWFLWVHCMALHLPYWASACYRATMGIRDDDVPGRLRKSVCKRLVVPLGKFRLEPQDRALVRRLYAAQVLEFNDRLAGVLECLDAHGLSDRTSIVLTADHGDELMEHGHVGHASTAEHATLYEEVLRIPLLVIDPRVTAPRRIGTRVQGLDLFPTLLSLAGVDPPGCEGVDLAPAIVGKADPDAVPGRLFTFCSAHRGYRTRRKRRQHTISAIADSRYKFVLERYCRQRTMLFDLEGDPTEKNPITGGTMLKEWLELAEAENICPR